MKTYFKHQKIIDKTEKSASRIVQFEVGDPVLGWYSESFTLGLSNILSSGQEFDTLVYNPETNSLEIAKNYRLYPFVCTHKREKKLGMVPEI